MTVALLPTPARSYSNAVRTVDTDLKLLFSLPAPRGYVQDYAFQGVVVCTNGANAGDAGRINFRTTWQQEGSDDPFELENHQSYTALVGTSTDTAGLRAVLSDDKLYINIFVIAPGTDELVWSLVDQPAPFQEVTAAAVLPRMSVISGANGYESAEFTEVPGALATSKIGGIFGFLPNVEAPFAAAALVDVQPGADPAGSSFASSGGLFVVSRQGFSSGPYGIRQTGHNGGKQYLVLWTL